MEIRTAQKGDIKQLIELCAAHAEYEKATYDKNGKAALLFDSLFNHKDILSGLVVVDQAQLIGYATFMKQFSTWNAKYYLYLDCLYLEESSRGKGIGTQFMQQIKAAAIQQNCAWIEWQTPVFNEKAIRFYNKIGATSKSKERFSWN